MPETPKASPRPVLAEMDWPAAQRALLDGQKVRRASWSDPTVCVLLAMFDEEYLSHRKVGGALEYLIVRGVDMRATDWVVVREH